MTVKGIFKAATDGYVSQTGHPLVDKILSRGGLTSMSFVVFLLLIAMTLGGILEGTGALGVVVDRMTRSVTSPGGLILATLVSCYLMTIGTGNGMLSIIVPARAFEKKFRDMGIQSRVLSRTLEDAVTLGIALVPYSMAAFFIVGVLKIDAMQYIPMPSSTGSSHLLPHLRLHRVRHLEDQQGCRQPRPPNPKPSRRGLPAECGLRRAPASTTQPHSGHKRPGGASPAEHGSPGNGKPFPKNGMPAGPPGTAKEPLWTRKDFHASPTASSPLPSAPSPKPRTPYAVRERKCSCSASAARL